MRGEVLVDRCNLGSYFITDLLPPPGSNSEAKEVTKPGSRTLAAYSRTADAALVRTGKALPGFAQKVLRLLLLFLTEGKGGNGL
jgi:hypothetical protein